MPYQWTAERERRMLLFAISSANLRPSAATWTAVAALLGEGLTASAVSQKYYKLRNEAAKELELQPLSPPSTPTKRKAARDEDEEKTPPSKRARMPKHEPLDGVPFSEASSSPNQAKAEDQMLEGEVNTFAHYHASFMPADYFLPVNTVFKVENSGTGSSSNSFLG